MRVDNDMRVHVESGTPSPRQIERAQRVRHPARTNHHDQLPLTEVDATEGENLLVTRRGLDA